MHHPRVTIFAAALSALGVMSFLSALLGNILPGLLPKQYTTAAAAILFFVFGAKMLREGLEMEGGEAGREKMEEEMREVQKEVQEVEEEVIGRPGGLALDEAEEGRSMLRGSPSDAEEGGLPTPVVSGSSSNGRGGRQAKDALNSVSEGIKNLAQLLFSPIFIQAFVLTFLAEWGDRSQITTIALGAAHVSQSRKKDSWQTRSTRRKLVLIPPFLSFARIVQNVWIVTMGTTLGHSICTGGAVLGGRWISQHISIKHGASRRFAGDAVKRARILTEGDIRIPSQ